MMFLDFPVGSLTEPISGRHWDRATIRDQVDRRIAANLHGGLQRGDRVFLHNGNRRRTVPVRHLLCWRRRKALSFGGMDEALAHGGPDDHDFPWTMLEHDAEFRAIHDALYVYRDHRTGFWLTTHVPRRGHLHDLRYILTKHRVAPEPIEKRLRSAKHGFLRQCLYGRGFHRWLKRLFGHDPASGWRLDYSK